ncbi:unnamed protein product [Rhodiola kirilowii]
MGAALPLPSQCLFPSSSLRNFTQGSTTLINLRHTYAPRTRVTRAAAADSQVQTAEDVQQPCVNFAFVSSVLLPDGTPDVHFRTACGGQKLRNIMLNTEIELYGPYSRPLLNCAGVGTCGTCIVEIVEGKQLLSLRTDIEKEKLKKKPKTWRLACQATVGNADSSGLKKVEYGTRFLLLSTVSCHLNLKLGTDTKLKMSDHHHQQQLLQEEKKGGFITLPFIIANEAFEKVSSYGLLPNMILYLMLDYGMELAKGTHVLFIWSAATNFMPIVGAFIADSYLGRFLSIGLGSISSLLGMILLWLTAMIPKLKPPSCHTMITTTACNSASPAQFSILFSSFALMSIGAGGVRPCSLAFGADQLNKQASTNKRVLESYFGWYYASAAVSLLIAFTGIVYIQDHLGWKIGFGVPALLMFLSASLFFMASSLYVKHHVSTNLLVNFAQVIVASYRKRKLPLSPLSTGDDCYCYHHEKGSEFLVPTDKLRFLNKACVVISFEEEMTTEGSVVNPWRTCTVEQVEQLKALLRVLPIWSTGIMMSVNTSQSSFQLVQANSMDRHLTSSFQIPAGSFAMFLIISLAAWIVLYDRIILPLASKLHGKPVRIGVKLRMGIGLFLTSLAMVVSATVEQIRRNKAVEAMHNSTGVVVTMSAMWLIPQYVIQGLAEAFNAIAQTEFYYSEFPKSMSSIAAALFGLGMAVASLLASAILSMVDGITSRNGDPSWVSSDINAGHFDWYYWVLAALSFTNIVYFIFCSLSYGPCSGDVLKTEGLKIEEELSMLGTIQVDEHKEDLPVRHVSSS